MKVYLTVPFSDRGKAKALGAKWDRSASKWFVLDPESLEPFMVWNPRQATTTFLQNEDRLCTQCRQWIKVHLGGGWRMIDHGRRRRWMCFHCYEKHKIRTIGTHQNATDEVAQKPPQD